MTVTVEDVTRIRESLDYNDIRKRLWRASLKSAIAFEWNMFGIVWTKDELEAETDKVMERSVERSGI